MASRPRKSRVMSVSDPATTARAEQPNAAQIYDYLLGGKDNYEVDRAAAEKLLEIVPDATVACYDNRQFLGRVVRYLVSGRRSGIRQIIDIGAGLSTLGQVHSVAHLIAPDTRVVYVDYNPVVLEHSRHLLANEPGIVATTTRPASRTTTWPSSLSAHSGKARKPAPRCCAPTTSSSTTTPARPPTCKPPTCASASSTCATATATTTAPNSAARRAPDVPDGAAMPIHGRDRGRPRRACRAPGRPADPTATPADTTPDTKETRDDASR